MIQREYGSIQELKSYIDERSPNHIFVVTGRDSYRSSSAQKKLEAIIDCEVTRFCDFSTNPKLGEALKIMDTYISINPDLIIAAGGGSVIDMAKLIKGLAKERDPIQCVIENKISGSDTPLIAIPMTAGSGSEATPFAVVYINGTKYSLSDPSLLPDEVVLDPSLTHSLASYHTAVSGMDALAQAIESYWSVNATDDSKEYSRLAIPLVLNNLEGAVKSPNQENRENMLKAANLAGKAIAIAKTTACHAISYPITSNYDVPHGHAVALTLPEILMYNSKVTDKDVNHKKGSSYVKNCLSEIVKLMGARSPRKAKAVILGLMKKIDLKTVLTEVEIYEHELIINQGFDPQRMKNNPRRINKDDLAKILVNIS